MGRMVKVVLKDCIRDDGIRMPLFSNQFAPKDASQALGL